MLLLVTFAWAKVKLAAFQFQKYGMVEGKVLHINADATEAPSPNTRSDALAGTIYENLILGSPSAGFEDIVQACCIAEIHETIEKLPKGYNTEIGEHGVGLSGGQKQTLAIARAVLKRTEVLVFDEATSSLDAGTAEQIAATINQMKGQVTMLYVAHLVPKGLQVDEVTKLGELGTRVRVVEKVLQ